MKATLTNAAAWIIVAILVLLPFHALLTVWVGSTFGIYDVIRLWKELLLVLLGAFSVYLLAKDKALFDKLCRRNPLFWFIGIFADVQLVWGLVAFARGSVNTQALLYGLAINLRFIAFFFSCWIIASRYTWLRQHWAKLLLVPAALVVVFGLLQAFLLPADVLRHAGYGPETIAAVQTVDQKEAYYRVQSTLRGSNPLGAYLVVVSSAILAWLITKRTSRQVTLAAGLFLVATLAVLGHTYSRSAYIGAAVAGVVVCWLLLRTTKARQWLLAGMIALALVAAGSFALLRDNDQFENTFFHTDETSQAADSSNEARAQALQQGIVDVAHEPLGRGPGTAGPASQYNLAPARIAENYYLQIGQEVGWIGLVLFIAILVMVGQALREQRKTAFGAMLLASLIGISLINLLSHAWTDDTLSLVWWGLAGIAIATPGILNTKDETG